MSKYKKMLGLLMVLVIFFSFFGCGPKGPAYPERDIDLPTELKTMQEDSIQIHYQRDDHKYEKWTLWLWDPDGVDDNEENDFNYQDDYGVIAHYPLSLFGELSSNKLGIIVKTKGSWTKDGTEADRFIDFSTLTKDENNVYHIYLAGDDPNLYTTPEKIITDSIKISTFYNEELIYVVCSNPIETYKIYCDGTLVAENSNAGKSFFSHKMEEKADFTKNYQVEILFRESKQTLKADVSMSNLYDSEMFNNLYYYGGQLGAIYSKNETIFKVWSPVSTNIELRVYESGTPTSISKEIGNDNYQQYQMIKKDKGVFEYVLSGDNQGKYYTYVVYNSFYPEGKEIVDPYTRSTGINGLRGMVVDFSLTNPEEWDKVKYLSTDRKQLTVWETHIADMTSNPSWQGKEENRRKYLGVIETGTSYTENGVTVSTGFDHLKELCINAIQFIPIYDQANDETRYTFNWGYNPLNYNALEGMYSSNPYDGYTKIREFKKVVLAFNEIGVSVIMDVVYNHVAGAMGSNFDVLMPNYYFRYNENGTLANGSGCGNETASENAMMRKFIIDSINFWTKEYKLGGFRFDLMGLHDIETMNMVAESAKKINPYIVIYGEPWTGGSTPLEADKQAKQANANAFVGYGQFNDQMRDALIKGGLSGAHEKGWVTGETLTEIDLKAIQNGINGITYSATYTISDSNKTVNYVTCHDNYTLYDRCKAAKIEDEEVIKKMCVLANSVVFTSNGTTFMLAGEEMLRTKQGDFNSYMSSDEINGLDYRLKVKHLDVFEVYQKLIEFKQKVTDLHQDNSYIDVVREQNGAIFRYELSDGVNHYVVIHGNGLVNNYTYNCKGYEVYLDTLNIYQGKVDSIILNPYQTIILKK